LKGIIKENPVVKYPFLMAPDGTFIFPFPGKTRRSPVTPFQPPTKPGDFLKKGSAIYRLFKNAEEREFKERTFLKATSLYLQCLNKSRGKKIEPYLYLSIARGYFKAGKMPQAIEYLTECFIRFPGLSKKDNSLYYRALFLQARAYNRMGFKGKSINIYLKLYELILRSELSGNPVNFTFFKNEALEYLNRNIDYYKNRIKTFERTRALEGLEELSRLDISLRWKYFELPLEPEGTRISDNGLKNGTGKGGAGDDFGKIKDFYLASDGKTLFYNKIKELNLWHVNKNVENTNAFHKRTVLQLKNRPDIVFIKTGKNTPGGKECLFGFMLSSEYIESSLMPGAAAQLPDAPSLSLSLEKYGPPSVTANNSNGFKLLQIPLNDYLPTRRLVLSANRPDYIAASVKKDMWINYGLISVIIIILIMGSMLFYKFISREAQLVRLKADFVDSASHTLKTPLTRIRMLAEKLELGWIKDENKKKEYFLKIISETDHMSALITNMLDFSKVESGKKSYLMKRDTIVPLVQTVIDSQKAGISNRGFELATTIDENIPPFEFDSEAVQLILLNLIENALKYSKEVRYLAVKLHGDHRSCILKVEDKGMGIPAKDLETIFHRFHRVENEKVKALEGSGLGL
ncbi:MAG: HAMP domain-containing histidine kinase, partial [bacterium]|nr:HAMP domain-containing histidine kinase [bacterium]